MTTKSNARMYLKFYFHDRNGYHYEMPMEKVREHLSEAQIEEALDAKTADTYECVSYMTFGGMITVDY